MYCALENRVLECIALKQEGESWDFKKEWHKDKQALLHDIICMSNQIGPEDGISIIGCDESNDYQVTDITNDPNRKNTANLVDFLREKNFAGSVRPIVYVHSMQVDHATIDVIVIKNTRNTPFYLLAAYGDVRAYHIYTRVMDTNTPKDKSADIDRIEKLWKKRFALDTGALERMSFLLKRPEDWDSVDGGESYYCKTAPEFTITFEEDHRDGYEYYMLNQIDTQPHWNRIFLKCHQTILFTTLGVGLDGGQYFTPAPAIEGFYNERHDYIIYKAFTCDSLLYQLNCFFFLKNETDESRHCRKRLFECVPIFSSDAEKKQFEGYASIHFSEATLPENSYLPQFPKCFPNGQNSDVFVQDFMNALKIKRLLDHFLMEQAIVDAKVDC